MYDQSTLHENTATRERTPVIRQGDVLLVPCPGDATAAMREVPPQPFTDELKPYVETDGDVVLALGEGTGHAHRIRRGGAVLYQDEDTGESTLVVEDRPVALSHEEHDTLEIPPGTYRIVRQREYDPVSKGWREVVD